MLSPPARSDSAQKARDKYKDAFARKIRELCEWSEDLYEEIFISGAAAHMRLQVRISGRPRDAEPPPSPGTQVVLDIANYAVHHRDPGAYFRRRGRALPYPRVLHDLRRFILDNIDTYLAASPPEQACPMEEDAPAGYYDALEPDRAFSWQGAYCAPETFPMAISPVGPGWGPFYCYVPGFFCYSHHCDHDAGSDSGADSDEPGADAPFVAHWAVPPLPS